MTQRIHIEIRGAVQGVGFRPFAYRLAAEMGLPGWVMNCPQGVFVEAEGEKTILDAFLMRLEKEKPPRAFIQSLEFSFLDPLGFSSFSIRESDRRGAATALVLPDSAICPACLREIFDPADRRYLYPFTNCTNCGPRFTIIESLPYDRPNTSMKIFTMCPECRREYEDPLDRRFHAQPNACPVCGPHLELWDKEGNRLGSHHQALLEAAMAIRSGQIIAVKGIGGFHLVVDARNLDAVERLRRRKHREEKPLALMYPSLEAVKRDCLVSDLEERLLLSPESPIVLLDRKSDRMRSPAPVGDGKLRLTTERSTIAFSVAPNNPSLGVMLPYSPLHHILLKELGFPVVATSGNLSDEPICTDEREAITRLHDIADVFLVHDRPIVRHVDDSVVRTMMGRHLILRRARGYAPLPVHLNESSGSSVLAVGAHLKNTIALTVDDNIFISQHIGDLETSEACGAFQKVIADFKQLYGANSPRIVSDLHPDYLSTKFARSDGTSVTGVQHHYAHVMSCMAENELEGPVLGISWDGTGYGPDGTIWGGEFLLTTESSYERVASFRKFRLPGGEIAVREPRRSAAGLLYEIFGEQIFNRNDLLPAQSFASSQQALMIQALSRGINSPYTSSVGRLFDAVASIVGLRQHSNFEGQAAMELEFAIRGLVIRDSYPFEISQNDPLAPQLQLIIDWQPMALEILSDLNKGTSQGEISAKFHNTLAEMIMAIAKRIGQQRVVLSGGCFQNKYLTERTIRELEAEGFHPYWHQRVPPNDGGISLGQAYAVVCTTRKGNGSFFPYKKMAVSEV